MVVHACDPSYSGGRDRGWRFLANPGKEVLGRPYLKEQTGRGGGCHICNASYSGSRGRKIVVQS
jgi:hypothetical protein